MLTKTFSSFLISKPLEITSLLDMIIPSSLIFTHLLSYEGHGWHHLIFWGKRLLVHFGHLDQHFEGLFVAALHDEPPGGLRQPPDNITPWASCRGGPDEPPMVTYHAQPATSFHLWLHKVYMYYIPPAKAWQVTPRTLSPSTPKHAMHLILHHTSQSWR